MSTEFSANEMVAINHFAQSFCHLYGSDNFRITDGTRSIPPMDSELNKLIVKMRTNKRCVRKFRSELAQAINAISCPAKAFVVYSPIDRVREALKLPKDTLLLSIVPKNDPTDADCTEAQLRARWMCTRLFKLTPGGIYPIGNVDIDTVMRPIVPA